MKTKEYFIERHKGGERAILVQIDFYQKHDPNALTEFQELADSAGVNTLSVIEGKRTEPTPKYFVGVGKAEEIRDTVQALEADVVLFNHELSPGQGRNLEKLFNCRVLDRAELILDIFASRARTYEGKLQVELAQLQHLSTRLVRGWTHLERQKGGIGLRGPGETQLETDRRLLAIRIKSIKKRLDKVLSQRHQSRRGRAKASIPTVSLVGYTNAGKSTLFNKITSAETYIADQLFATLDPTLKQLKLPALGKVIVADTVGFIRDLPHALIAAFRATLEETRLADLLLHVVDVSAEDTDVLIHDVDVVLSEIGARQVPQLMVCNKIDLVGKYKPRIDYHADGKPKRVWLSAHTGEGLDCLFQAIVECLADQMVTCEITIAHEEGGLRAKLYEMDVVKNESVDENGCAVLTVEMQRKDFEALERKRKTGFTPS